MIIEGVEYFRYVVSYALKAEGAVPRRRRYMVRWAPHSYFLRPEVASELGERFGDRIEPRSVFIEPADVRTARKAAYLRGRAGAK